jgi:hypothetical protein
MALATNSRPPLGFDDLARRAKGGPLMRSLQWVILGLISLVGILSPREGKGGSSGSWLTTESFDKYSKPSPRQKRAEFP